MQGPIVIFSPYMDIRLSLFMSFSESGQIYVISHIIYVYITV